jgi:hypothetical protein
LDSASADTASSTSISTSSFSSSAVSASPASALINFFATFFTAAPTMAAGCFDLADATFGATFFAGAAAAATLARLAAGAAAAATLARLAEGADGADAAGAARLAAGMADEMRFGSRSVHARRGNDARF